MRSVGDHYLPLRNTALVAAAKIRASQKLNPASGLHAQLREDPNPGTRSGNGRRKSDLCRSGTEPGVPFRYGLDAPRLDAAFVAQLLGQMMPDCAARNTGTLAAYAEASSPAQVFDAQL